MDAINAVGMVDISFTLIDLVDIYGIKTTNNILRKFGTDRLIFGSDFPENRYEEYFNILKQIDFTLDEIKQKPIKILQKYLK